MRVYLLIIVGGAIGALARWGGEAIVDSTSMAILLINTLGALVLGFAFTRLDERYPEVHNLDVTVRPGLQPLIATGGLGAFTTYSALCLHVVQLWQVGETAHAVLVLGASLVFGMVGLAIGVAFGHRRVTA